MRVLMHAKVWAAKQDAVEDAQTSGIPSSPIRARIPRAFLSLGIGDGHAPVKSWKFWCVPRQVWHMNLVVHIQWGVYAQSETHPSCMMPSSRLRLTPIDAFWCAKKNLARSIALHTRLISHIWIDKIQAILEDNMWSNYGHYRTSASISNTHNSSRAKWTSHSKLKNFRSKFKRFGQLIRSKR